MDAAFKRSSNLTSRYPTTAFSNSKHTPTRPPSEKGLQATDLVNWKKI